MAELLARAENQRLAKRLDKVGWRAMEEGHEVANEDERKAKLLAAYAAAKTKMQTLQDAVRVERASLDGIVEYLKSGGDRGRVAEALDSYLTGTLTDLMQDMWVVCVEMEALERELSGLGITIPD